MKLNKRNADIYWGEDIKAWIRDNEVIVETPEGIETMTIGEFRAEHEGAFAADETHIVEYGDLVIEHTLLADFHNPLFEAVDTIEGAFKNELSPGKMAEELYNIDFPRGIVTLEFSGNVIIINTFEQGVDKVTLFNHLINVAAIKYNFSADEAGRYSISPDFEWEVMGYDTKIYPVSDEIWKLYNALKDDFKTTSEEFIEKDLDFKVKIYSEFGGTIELDMADKKDRTGLIYNMLSMIFGTKLSRPKILEISKTIPKR